MRGLLDSLERALFSHYLMRFEGNLPFTPGKGEGEREERIPASLDRSSLTSLSHPTIKRGKKEMD